MTESYTKPTEMLPDDEGDPRRVAPRYECRHVTFYKPVSKRGRESELATVHDISISGVGLLVRERIEPGTILTIELNSTINKVRHELLARVTHATDQGNGYLLIGCEFAMRLTEAALDAMTH